MANTAYIQGMGKVNVAPADYYKSSAAQISSGGSKGLAGATITAGVLSGIADIATGFINAGRIRQTAKFNEAMADIENRMIGVQRTIAKSSAKYEIAQIRRRSDQLYSQQRALYAKAGVRLEGSPAEVMTESLKEAEMDAIITDINAEYTDIGLEVSQWSNKSKTDIANIGASSAYANALMGASKTILNMGVKYWREDNMAVIPKYQSTRRIEGINSIPSGGRTSTENIARDAAAQKEAIQGVEETENALVKVRQIQQINAASTYATEAMNALKDKADQDPEL